MFDTATAEVPSPSADAASPPTDVLPPAAASTTAPEPTHTTAAVPTPTADPLPSVLPPTAFTPPATVPPPITGPHPTADPTHTFSTIAAASPIIAELPPTAFPSLTVVPQLTTAPQPTVDPSPTTGPPPTSGPTTTAVPPATAAGKNKALPRVFLSNACSLTNKMDELEYVLLHNHIDIAAVTESWFKTEKEDISQLDQYKTYNKNREEKDCGGITVFIKNDIPCTVVQVDTDEHEILWFTLRPKWLPRDVSVIILAVFYYAPKTLAATRDRLIKHIITTVQLLQTKHSNPGVMILGDYNTLPEKEIMRALNLKQVVKVPTRGKNILDKILTNIQRYYKAPVSLPALGNSDHSSVLWEPIEKQKECDPIKTQYSRRFPDSGIREFGSWITQQDWQEVLDAEGTDNKCDLFHDIIWKKIDAIFPLKKRRTHSNDKPWMNNKIKGLIADRQKAHSVGNNELRKQLARKIAFEIKQAKKDYHATQMGRIRNAEPRNWFNHMKRILGTKKKDSLNNITELANCPDKSAEIINKHFSDINTTLPPLCLDDLPSFLPARPTPITLSEHQVYRHLSKIPVTKAPGPGDIPPRLLKEFAPELAKPYCDIFNASLREGVFPKRWKRAFAVPVPKVPTPNTLDDIRPVSLTPNPGKTLERIVAEEVWKTITPQLDPRQYGNVKGSSCLHYLVDYIDFVSSNVDKGNEVAAVTIDLRKAFDLVDHNILIRKLLDLKIHESLVKWIASFISDRTVATRAYGQVSSELPLHCGVPQGTVLGPLLFIIMVNENWDPASRIYKYVDDTTIAVAYKPGDTPPIQEILLRVSEWTKVNNMQINPKKCAVLNYKFNLKPVTLPPLSIDGSLLSVVKSVNLLGAKISDDLKWTLNTKNILTKCSAKLYMLSRLKAFKVARHDLVKIWTTFIRPITEYVAPLWHSSLTITEKEQIERLQKRALRIIMGADYPGYDDALKLLNLPSLKNRREDLAMKFAKDILKSKKHRKLLPEKRNNDRTMRCNVGDQLIAPKWKRLRYGKSTIPYCIRLINKDVGCQFYCENM